MIRDVFTRWRWAILVTVILLAGLFYALWPEPRLVDTSEVTKGPMQVGITDDGVTRAEEFYVVSAPVSGYIARIELEPGDEVAAGALITRMGGRLTSPLDRRSRAELQSALQAANAATDAVRASLKQAERDLARAEELAGRGFLPQARLEAARTQVATEQSALAGSQAEAARIRAMLSGGGASSGEAIAVRAPSGGSVLSVINESEGMIVEGTPLITIGDPQRIEAVIDLLSRDAVQVKPGAKVQITQWGGPDPLTGTVQQVEPFGRLKISALGIEEQRVNVIVSFDRLSNNQAARLGHGYQVDATIIQWRTADAIRIPIGALFRAQNGRWRAFVVNGGRARETELEIGHINDEFGEALSGVSEGDVVIVNPASSMSDGVRVRSREPNRQ